MTFPVLLLCAVSMKNFWVTQRSTSTWWTTQGPNRSISYTQRGDFRAALCALFADPLCSFFVVVSLFGLSEFYACLHHRSERFSWINSQKMWASAAWWFASFLSKISKPNFQVGIWLVSTLAICLCPAFLVKKILVSAFILLHMLMFDFVVMQGFGSDAEQNRKMIGFWTRPLREWMNNKKNLALLCVSVWLGAKIRKTEQKKCRSSLNPIDIRKNATSLETGNIATTIRHPLTCD